MAGRSLPVVRPLRADVGGHAVIAPPDRPRAARWQAEHPHNCAVALLAFLEAHDWPVFLDEHNHMAVRIGPELAELSQPEILSLLASLESEVIAIVRSLRTVH
jgi:hypothetical protein